MISIQYDYYKLKNHLEFFLKIESFFVPKSIEIYGHIFKCIFSVDYNVIEVK